MAKDIQAEGSQSKGGAAANGGARRNRAEGRRRTHARTSNTKRAGRQEDRYTYSLMKPVFFVGFMGAGKTSVARRIARTCGIASVDMDSYLERREGKRVNEIFAEGGEELFRSIETDVLAELGCKEDPLLISCGGGVVLRKENRDLLNQLGVVVYLRVTADEAAARISDKSTRPLFQDIEAARKRCQERLPLYEMVANITVDTQGRSVPAIARHVRSLLEKEGALCRQPK